MIQAIIFDMDGLIIDSEPLWREAEIETFGNYGIKLTEEDCRKTTGMRVDEVVQYWAEKNTEVQLNCEKTAHEITEAVARLIEKKGEALPGLYPALEFFKNIKLPMAIASASSYKLIHLIIKRLNLENVFQIIQSAENMTYGKPHPEVFLEAAKRLKVAPETCLVFEDSVYGVLAAKASKMKVIAIPDARNYENKGYCIADVKLTSMTAFTKNIWENLTLQ